MPRNHQIVPNYLHPHIETYLNDNTEFHEEVAPPIEPVRLLSFIVSSEGRDGVFLPFDTEPEARAEFGVPNFKLHGQPIYNAYEALKTQQARVNIMRIMPDDAAYANVVIIAKVKVDNTTGTAKMITKFTAASIAGLKDLSDFSTQVELLEKTDTQSDGFKHIPVAAFHVAGRGAYGNNFRIRLTRSPEEDREYKYSFFRVEVLKNQGTLLRKEVHIGATHFDAHEGDNSLYMEDRVNDTQFGSKIIKMQLIESNIKQLFDMYKKEVVADTKLTEENFDIFFGLDKLADEEGTKIKNYEFDTEGEGAISLTQVEGIPMVSGDDGKFAYDEAKLQERATAIKDGYIAAMTGKTSKVVFSKARMPIDIILDAAYEKDVKKALAALIMKRKDAYGYLDAGIIRSTEDALQWAKEMQTLGDLYFSKEFQHGEIRDSYTGKRIPMTTTWFLASRLPIHIKIQGRHIPFQGQLHARVTGYLRNTILPVIDMDDKDLKEQFYTMKCNYYESIAENTVIRGTQGTSQNKWSDLSEENNVLVTLDIKRNIERLVASKIYNFAEAEDRARFTEEARRMIAPYKGVQCRDADVYFDMNKWEEERSILHCYLWIIFRTLAKRGIIEIDINKRV